MAGARVTAGNRGHHSGQVRAAVIVVVAALIAGCHGGHAVKVPEPQVAETIVVTSTAFGNGQPIPREHTCHGPGHPPDLAWHGVPDSAKSLALVVSDPDAPRGTFIHWVVYDLPPRGDTLPSGKLPPGAHETENSGGKRGWYPPCPPSGTHRYQFILYALSEPVTARSTQDVLDEIGRRAVASGTLTGLVSAA
jgi:Raf kinase inhibitor-like YbhB/YbcL family protein